MGTAETRDYNDAYLPFDWRGWSDFGTGALVIWPAILWIRYTEFFRFFILRTVECSVSDAFKGKFETADYPKSFPNSSTIYLKYPRTDGKGSIDVTWMDGGLRPQT